MLEVTPSQGSYCRGSGRHCKCPQRSLEAQKVRGQKRGHYSPPGLEKSPSGPTSCTPVGPFFWTHLAPEAVEIQLQPQRSFRVSKLHVCIMQTERKERRKEAVQKSMPQTQHHESAIPPCVCAHAQSLQLYLTL